MTFKVGDIVKFVENHGYDTPKYFTEWDGIPASKLEHGSLTLGEKYKKEFARIVDTHNEYFIVAYTSDENKEVRLGFKAESLIPVVINNWKEVIERK